MNPVKFLRVIFAGLFALLVLAPTNSAAAAEKEIFRSSFRGESAVAVMTHSDGCVYEGLSVRGIDGRSKADGRPDAISAVSVGFWHYDSCGHTWVDAWGYVDVDADAFQINNSLRSATLNTTIELYDYWSSTSIPVDLNLTFEGIGDPSRSKETTTYKSPVYRYTYRTDSTYRQATASGSVTTPFGALDFEQANYAYMQSVKSGSMTIYQQ